MITHRNALVSAPSESNSMDAELIPPAASRAEANSNSFMEMDDMINNEWWCDVKEGLGVGFE